MLSMETLRENAFTLTGFFPDVRGTMTTVTIFVPNNNRTYYEPISFIYMNLHYAFTHINSMKPYSHPMSRYCSYSHFIDTD